MLSSFSKEVEKFSALGRPESRRPNFLERNVAKNHEGYWDVLLVTYLVNG